MSPKGRDAPQKRCRNITEEEFVRIFLEIRLMARVLSDNFDTTIKTHVIPPRRISNVEVVPGMVNYFQVCRESSSPPWDAKPALKSEPPAFSEQHD